MVIVRRVRRGFIYYLCKNSSSLYPSLSVNRSTSSSSQPVIDPSFPDSLMQKYHFQSETASMLASIVTTLKKQHKSDDILSFLTQNGFSPAQLEKILKSWPKLLSMKLDKIIKPKIKIFHDFAFSNSEIAEIISMHPDVLHSSASKRMIPSLQALIGLLKSTEKVAEILKVSGWYLKNNLDSSLLPNINLLTNCGVPMDKINWLMRYFPRLMLQSPRCLRKYVDKADRMGADRCSKMYVHSVRVVASMSDETWYLKVRNFQDMGFSEGDVKKVFRIQPQVLSISTEKMMRVKEAIVASGKYDVSCIVKNPNSLSRSVKRRYMPRFAVLRVLEAMNLIRAWPSFATMYTMTDKSFFERYVVPYRDAVGEVYMEMRREKGDLIL